MRQFDYREKWKELITPEIVKEMDELEKLLKQEVTALNNDIVLFETKDKQITLSVPVSGETVWLTQDQRSELFDTARSSIAYHIGNIYKETELDKDSYVEIFDRSENCLVEM